MSTHPRRVVLAGVATLGVLGIAAGSADSLASPAPKLAKAMRYGFSADAFGSRLQAAGVADSGRSALTTLGCTTHAGVTHSNSTERAQKTPAGSVGSVRTKTATTQDSDSAATASTSTVHGFSLFNGVVQATAVKSTATASHASDNTTSGSTKFVNLTVAGHPVDSTPPPNQTYQLPGVGTLTLNAQRATSDASSAKLTVDGLTLKLAKANSAELPGKTELVLGHATAAVTSVGYVPLTGSSYGTALLNDSAVHSGRSFDEVMPCGGTTKPARNSGAGVTVADALRTGSVTSTAVGHPTGSTGVTGTTKSTIQHVHLLGGLVTATAVTARATVNDQAGQISSNETGSRFVDLQVRGHQLPAAAKPNTKISLGALGTLWLNRVVRTHRGITVHMIDLHLSKPSHGLASGADLVVANATAGVRN